MGRKWKLILRRIEKSWVWLPPEDSKQHRECGQEKDSTLEYGLRNHVASENTWQLLRAPKHKQTKTPGQSESVIESFALRRLRIK